MRISPLTCWMGGPTVFAVERQGLIDRGVEDHVVGLFRRVEVDRFTVHRRHSRSERRQRVALSQANLISATVGQNFSHRRQLRNAVTTTSSGNSARSSVKIATMASRSALSLSFEAVTSKHAVMAWATIAAPAASFSRSLSALSTRRSSSLGLRRNRKPISGNSLLPPSRIAPFTGSSNDPSTCFKNRSTAVSTWSLSPGFEGLGDLRLQRCDCGKVRSQSSLRPREPGSAHQKFRNSVIWASRSRPSFWQR